MDTERPQRSMSIGDTGRTESTRNIGSGARAGRLRTFAYVTFEKAWLYRAVTEVFVRERERFGLNLRPAEVHGALDRAALAEPVDVEGVEAALSQLCDWGNLTAHNDTAEVTTVEEFYRVRQLYQLTAAGEAAERALALYHDTLVRPGELQAAALGDIRALLAELAQLAAAGEPDPAKIHLALTALRTRFDDLTGKAQTFIGSLQRTIDLHGLDIEAFLAYKDLLIDYLERFIGELVLATAEIADAIARVEAAGVDRLLAAAAERDLVDALEVSEDERAETRQRWDDRWHGLRGWFVGAPGRQSQAEVLRARARSAIPALLLAVAGINDRRVTRTDRVTDLRTLARWFAQADDDAGAHRLWRAAFGLAPARHLRIDDETLDARDAEPVPAHTSWLTAPPLLLEPRLRATGRHAKPGRPASVIDRSKERMLLAELAKAEAAQVESARARLTSTGRVRLSALGPLDASAFGLFCDLLGDALAGKVRPNDIVETVSADGTLLVRLAPTGDGCRAVIETGAGRLSGPDHWLDIRDAFESAAIHADEPEEEVA